MKKAALFFLALGWACACLAALGDTPAMLANGVAREGKLELRMLDGGFSRAKNGLMYPEARLLFSYGGTEKRFHKNVRIELVELSGGKRLAFWNTFLSLKPGKSLNRRYGRESLAAWASVEAAPALALKVFLTPSKPEVFPLPARPLP